MASAVEAWTWLIAENPHVEVALMSEILDAWTDTISQQRGAFSPSLKYVPSYGR
jgi:phosphatidylinositol 4-kinase A